VELVLGDEFARTEGLPFSREDDLFHEILDAARHFLRFRRVVILHITSHNRSYVKL